MADEKSGTEAVDEEKTPAVPAPASEDAEGEAAKTDSPKDGEGEGEGEGGDVTPESIPKVEDAEVPVRRSTGQHIIARKNTTIKKLRSNDGADDTVATPELDEHGQPIVPPVTPVAPTDVAGEIAKQMEPVVKIMTDSIDEGELTAFLKDTPESKPYEPLMRKYMAHESYAGIPPIVIYHHLAFKGALAGSIKAKEDADTEAGHTQGGGTGRRPSSTETGNVPTVEAMEAMNDEEFETLERDALAGKFLDK